MTPMLGIISSQKTASAPPVTGYKLWLDATIAASITSSGGAVSQWNDQSGNGYNFVQATGANQPITGTRTINGKNVIDFDGTNDSLSNATASNFTFMSTSAGTSTFIVGFRDTSASAQAIMDNCDGSSTLVGYYIGTSSSDLAELVVSNATSPVAIAQFGGPTVTDNAAFYLTILTDPGNGTAANRGYISYNAGSYDQSNTSTGTPSGSAPTNTMKIGTKVTPSNYYNGTIGEIIVYPSKLSAGNVSSIKSYLSAKWGI